MNILLTNDDGIHAPGLKALLACLGEDVAAFVVAPADEKSASSHSISLGQRLEVEESIKDGVRHCAVYGTPADCVKFALSEIKEFRPDLIVSGINQGANTGVSVFYSGTISAAREGLINCVPSMAISLCSSIYRDFIPCMKIARRIIQSYRDRLLPPDIMLNVNVPPIPQSAIKGVKITKQAASRFVEEFVPEEEDGGKKIYTLAGEIELSDPDGTSDEEAVAGGYISITPLKLDLTEYKAIDKLRNWLNGGDG